MLQRNKIRIPLRPSRLQNKESRAVKNIFRTIRQWQRNNAAAKMLNRLNDSMLADIGVVRSAVSKDIHIFH